LCDSIDRDVKTSTLANALVLGQFSDVQTQKTPKARRRWGFGTHLIWLQALALPVGRAGAWGRGLGLTRCCAVAAT